MNENMLFLNKHCDNMMWLKIKTYLKRLSGMVAITEVDEAVSYYYLKINRNE